MCFSVLSGAGAPVPGAPVLGLALPAADAGAQVTLQVTLIHRHAGWLPSFSASCFLRVAE